MVRVLPARSVVEDLVFGGGRSQAPDPSAPEGRLPQKSLVLTESRKSEEGMVVQSCQ